MFEQIGSFENAEEAFTAGRSRVSTTAAASLRVSASDESYDLAPAAERILPKTQFTKSKKESGVFVERREQRIKSPGEKFEITFKGIAAQKQRRGGGFKLF